MEKACSDRRYIFPLTGLQIGDLQSYLSHLSLFLAPDSKKLYILVDNKPWLDDLGYRSAHLWQLMVTKSRLSPFANSKVRKSRKDTGKLLDLKSNPTRNPNKSKPLEKWFSLIDTATLSRKRALLPVKKLQKSLLINSKLNRTLYGFIVFEVAWSDVRGINYLNELQTDTSLAIEAKHMKRWEFDSIAEADDLLSSWFPGTQRELLILKDYLASNIGDVFYDAEENFQSTSSFCDDQDTCDDDDNLCAQDQFPCDSGDSFKVYPMRIVTDSSITDTPPLEGPYKRRKVIKSDITPCDIDMCTEETSAEMVDSPGLSETCSDCEELVEATQYKDVLILFRFNDRDLPFKLKDIVISDLRLLTLLEAGLPSWVLFLQSYPVFCHLYRPWMCPLARTLYVLISVVTVLIGFYDLYKNVPVLKATASRLCGPLFDWIETWEMITRIRYLGTMLFLHNFQKALTWSLMVTRTLRSFISVLTQPLAGPLVEFVELILPLWNMCIEIIGSLFSVIWLVIGSSFNLVENLVEIILSPILFILTTISTIATSIIYPIFWILWEILYAPIRLIVALTGGLTFFFSSVYLLLRDVWLFASGIIKFASKAEATVSAVEVSLWRSLWNDLFSQVFRALRTILNGFVAFFAACNRHRLSIYNHTREFIHRLLQPTQRLPQPARRLLLPDYSHRGQTCGTQNVLDARNPRSHSKKKTS